jgi:hypothetical protein
VTVLHAESLHCCFTINHRGNDLAFLATFLAADDKEISVADGRIDHGIALDLEHEELTLADDGFGKEEGLKIRMLPNRYQLKLTLRGRGPYGSESDYVIDYKEQNERKREFGAGCGSR